MICFARPKFSLSKRDNLCCESYICLVGGIQPVFRDPYFPCRGDMACVARSIFSFSRRYGLLCEIHIFLVEARWAVLRDPLFPCRGEMDRKVENKSAQKIAISQLKSTFPLSRRYGLLCETQILLVEAIWLALRDFNFTCPGDMTCVARPEFYLSRRDGSLCETSILYVEAIWLALRDLDFPCPGDKTCLSRAIVPKIA
jgi:hypothetical protein